VAARPGFAQVAAPDSARMRATGSRVSTEVAVLHIANRPVFEFRSSFLGYPPRKRLEAALDRVSGALQTGGGGKVTTDAVDLGVMMEVNGQMIFVVTPGDVDPLMQETLDDLVARTRADVQAAILAYREQRSLDSLISSILRALLATVIVARALQYLRRLVLWLTGVLERYASRRVQRLKLPPSGLTTQLVALVRLILRAAGIALAIIFVYSWLAYVLNQFPYTSPWGDQLGNYLSHTVVTVVMAILRSLPGLLMMVIIFALARLATRWLRMLFVGVRSGRFELPGVDADTALPTQRLIVIFLWVLAVALAFPFIPGSGGPAFKGISVLLGLMVSLGASSVVGQAASGYILMYSRSIRQGDFVRIGDYEGTVVSMSMLSTKIRTALDEEINVPNAVIISSITKNYTRLTKDTGAVMTTTVTIGYGTPWRQVHAMLAEAAQRCQGLREDDKPRIMQEELSDFYVAYTLLVRLVRPDTRAVVRSELHAHIQDVFNENSVQIMSPHYENDPAAKVWVPKEKWHQPPAGLDEV
jgi:small-conductance mechanosensitive channel